MAYFSPDTPITFEYGGTYTPPLSSVVAFAFSDTTTRAIPETANISVEISDATVSILYNVDGGNVQIPVIASGSVIESLFIIDSANAIIEAVVSESEIFKQHSVRSDDTIIGVEITESVTSESNSYIFHFFVYSPPDASSVNFTYGDSSADYRVASEYITATIDLDTSIIDISVGVNAADSEISFSSTNSIIEACESILSKNVSIAGLTGESSVEDYHDIPALDIGLDFNVPVSMIEEYHGIESVGLDIAADTTPSVIENCHIISSNIVNVMTEISGLDIDGNVSTDFNLTKIPEIASDNIGLAANINETIIGGGQYQNLPVSGKGYASVWGDTKETVHVDSSLQWDTALIKDKSARVPFQNPQKINAKSDLKWIGVQVRADENPRVNWELFEDTPGKHINAPFTVVMDKSDEHSRVKWNKFDIEHSLKKGMGYLAPGPKDRAGNFPWETFSGICVQKSMNYFQPLPNDIQHRTYWGPKWYSLFCGIQYYPPSFNEQPPMRFDSNDWIDQGAMDWEFGDPRNFRCPWNYPYSGPRAPYNPPITPGDPAPGQLTVPVKGYYYIMNSTFIQRISGNMESIDFQSVSMSIDRDSWLWSFSIVILSKDSLNLIKPQSGVYTDIEINCNGWKWTCRVENWRETIVFGKKAWTVTGRSASIEIGEPYSVIPSFSNDEAHGGQIIDDILSTSGSGWSAEWENNTFDPHLNWLIPAGALNTVDSSIFKTIQMVTDAVGAFVQTTANTNTLTGATGEKKLIIQPKYRENPWKWGTAITADVILTDAICNEIGRQNSIKQTVDSSIVYGENNGCIVNAVKDGTAGANPASIIMDAGITTPEAGAERARHIIGDSGSWVIHSLKLFSLMPDGTAPGLLLPGNFITMNETGDSWTGQITGVSVTSGWGQNGLETVQNIEVEQYIG